MELNEEKKLKYINELLFSESKFKFVDSIYFDFKNKITDDMVMVQTYKYDKNSYPNDFFSRMTKVKPKILT